jgi:hypothetical protein
MTPRIIPGTVIVFDEFFNFPGWRDFEFRAFQEWLDSSGARFEYLGYVSRAGGSGSGAQLGLRVVS